MGKRNMISRRKKTVIIVLLVSTLLFGALQVLHYQEEYSPLQMLSGAENEAQRLLRFLTSYQYWCNSTLYSSNTSVWSLCIEQDVGISRDSNVPRIAYSVGPLPDFSFETLLSQNLSIRQLIFLPEPTTKTPLALQRLNATVFHTTVVPNDPADFSRNSYNTHTINSIMSKMGHRQVDILKLEHLQDMTHSYEVLYFLAKDGILTRFRQLHVVIEIDKVDENYLYGWYKTLYTLFHSAGFRLYHTSASSPLCLQVTMMESCRYFVSWIRNPGPETSVMYPPAIDGSEESEVQRLKDFLDLPKQSSEDVISVVLSASIIMRLSRQVIMSGSDNCHILLIKFETGLTVMEEVSALHVKCSVAVLIPLKGKHSAHDFTSFIVRRAQAISERMTLSEAVFHFLPAREQTNIVYIDLGISTWSLLASLLDSGALQNVSQLVLVAPVFPVSLDGKYRSALALRQRYSELQRVTAYHMVLNEATTLTQSSLTFQSQEDLWQMSFVRT